jgi:CBS domain-containing protein
MMLVKEIMRRPHVIERDIGIAEAAKIMSASGIGSLIFVSGKKIAGIVTEKDILENFNKNTKVSHVMTKKIITCGPDDSMDIALDLMRKNKVKRLPVVMDGNLAGIITLTDIMANFEALEEEFFFE